MVKPHTQRIRQILGILTILVILGLIIAEAFIASVSVAPGRLNLLVGLAGGLLGLDALRARVTGGFLRDKDIGISITPNDPETGGKKD